MEVCPCSVHVRVRIVARSACYRCLVRPSVFTYQCDSYWTNVREIDTGDFMKICQETQNLVKIRVKISGFLHENASFIAAGENKSP
jgi:hypothetical protein